MTEEQRFEFDVQGYLILKSVLDRRQVSEMLAQLDEHGVTASTNDPTKSHFIDFLEFGPLWRNLIDHPAIMPVLTELFGDRFRLDHAYGMAMRADAKPGGEGLHHEAGMFQYGCYYATHGSRMHNGLMVFSWALTDAPAGSGGFCCIPGSHKAAFPVPKTWFGVYDNPMIRQVPMAAGDLLVFNEALTHGTMPWTNKNNERRSVLMKYCPVHMQWAKSPMRDVPGATDRQKRILEPPWMWQRPPTA